MPARDSLARMMARPIAHRGLHGCGAAGPIENTIPAALAAIGGGYGIECDVRFARDHTPIVIHDATLERLAGRNAAVADLDAAEIAGIALADGGSIPTLADFLAAIDGRVALVIEIKAPAAPDAIDDLLGLVAGHGGPLVLESFDRAILARMAQAPCPIGLVGPDEAATATMQTELPRCDFLSWNLAHLETRPIGLPLTSWTVRSADQAILAQEAKAQIVFEGWRP